MKKLLAVLPAAALLLAGCGSEVSDALSGDSCQTAPAAVQAQGSSCTLAPGTTVTVLARPACQTCKDTRPSCNVEVLGTDIELNPVFRQCSEQQSCASEGCGFEPIQCVFTTPNNASGQFRFAYPTQSGSVAYRNVNVAQGGGSSCTL